MVEPDTSTDSKTIGMSEVEQIVSEQVEKRLSDLGIDIRSEDGNPSLEDVWIAGQPIGKIVVSTQKTAKSVEKEVENKIENSSDSQDEKGGVNEDTMLPIERLAKMKEQDENHPALPKNGRESFDRALSIYENFKKWSDKAPKGRVIKSGLKTLLETVTGQDLFWSQVKRACRMLERYSKGSIRLEKTKRHGNVLVAENQSVLAGGG